MTFQPKNIPLAGLFPVPERLETSSVEHRATFWKLIGAEALRLKRLEVLEGIDRWGNPFQPVKRRWGNPTPLAPHGESSRTYRLLAANSTARGATLFWRSGGGRTSWKTILGYHAYRRGPRNLPVRDEIGLSPRGVEGLVAQSRMWEAGYAAGLAARGGAGKGGASLGTAAGIREVDVAARRQAEAVRAEVVRKASQDEQVRKLIATRKAKLAAEDRHGMSEADRLTREAQEESRAIMDDLRLEVIRRRQAEKEAKARAKVRTRKETRQEETSRLSREAQERARAGIEAEIGAAERTLAELPRRGLSRESLEQFVEAKGKAFSLSGMVSAVRQRHGPNSPEYKAAKARHARFEGMVEATADFLVLESAGKDPTRGMFHGMVEKKTFHAVEFEGAKFHFEEGLQGAVVETLINLSSVDKLPSTLTSKTKDIYFVKEENSKDPHWRIVYNNPDHVSAATGGYGKVVIYNGKSIGAGGVVHEMGHNFAQSIYGSTHPSVESAYTEAMNSGEPAVSAYARNSPAEDFAESVKYYFLDKKNFAELHPKRFAVVDKLMKGEDIGG